MPPYNFPFTIPPRNYCSNINNNSNCQFFHPSWCRLEREQRRDFVLPSSRIRLMCVGPLFPPTDWSNTSSNSSNSNTPPPPPLISINQHHHHHRFVRHHNISTLLWYHANTTQHHFPYHPCTNHRYCFLLPLPIIIILIIILTTHPPPPPNHRPRHCWHTTTPFEIPPGHCHHQHHHHHHCNSNSNYPYHEP